MSAQMKEFKYLGVLFASEGTMEREIGRRIGAAGAVLRSLYRTVVTKRELSRKAKLSIYRSIFVPILTYGHEQARRQGGTNGYVVPGPGLALEWGGPITGPP